MNALEAKYCVSNKSRTLAVVNGSTDGLILGLIRRSSQPGESVFPWSGRKEPDGGWKCEIKTKRQVRVSAERNRTTHTQQQFPYSWSESLTVFQQAPAIKASRLPSRHLRNNIYVLMYSLSMCQMNTLITVLLLYEWNDILCHFACVIDRERNQRGYIVLSRWLGCAGPWWLVISPMPGGSGAIQRQGRDRVLLLMARR